MVVNFSQNSNQEDDFKKLLKKNLELTEEIYKMTKKIKRFVNFQQVMSLVYFLIIVVPIVLGIIYLPPLLNNYINQYKEILGIPGGEINILDLLKGGSGGLPDLKNLDPKNLPANYQDLLKGAVTK